MYLLYNQVISSNHVDIMDIISVIHKVLCVSEKGSGK
jgi:hypothetical protein